MDYVNDYPGAHDALPPDPDDDDTLYDDDDDLEDDDDFEDDDEDDLEEDDDFEDDDDFDYVLYQALSGREFVCRPGLAYVRETGDLTQVVFTDHLGDVWTMLLGPEDLHLFAAMRDRVSALLAAARTPTPNAPTTKTLQ